MKKQDDKLSVYTAELTRSFQRWNHLYEHGGSDPFHEDGVNLNLVRNHIIYFKRKIEEFMEQENLEPTFFTSSYPDVYYKETPPEVAYDYMANPDNIRRRAKEQLAYTYVASKSVADADGFLTDYTWYSSSDGTQVFVFGDNDIYKPEDGSFDHVCESMSEAQEWFDSYEGFLEQGEQYSSLDSKILSASQRSALGSDNLSAPIRSADSER